MEMKKFLIVISLLIAGLMPAWSQGDSAKKEKIFREVQEFKLNYMAEKMDLSGDQKKKFEELYEEMSQSRRECYADVMRLDKRIKHDKNASDDQYEELTSALNKANAEWAEKEKAYNEKFAEFLSPKQIYKMREAEASFKAKLDEMKHSRKKDHPKGKKN